MLRFMKYFGKCILVDTKNQKLGRINGQQFYPDLPAMILAYKIHHEDIFWEESRIAELSFEHLDQYENYGVFESYSEFLVKFSEYLI